METTFKNFKITATTDSQGYHFPFAEKTDRSFHYMYAVEIRDTTNSNNYCEFDFYGSAHDYEKGNAQLEESDLLHAFYCLLSDATCQEGGFESFCAELGYDEDSRRAYSAFEACREQMEKVDHLGLTCDKACDLMNELQEIV